MTSSEMEIVDRLAQEQKIVGEMMNTLLTNMKKDGPSRKTLRYIEDKKRTFMEYWAEFRRNHKKITDLNIPNHVYLEKEYYQQVQGIYEEALKLLDTYGKSIEKIEQIERQAEQIKTGVTVKNVQTSTGDIPAVEENGVGDFTSTSTKNEAEQILRLKKQKFRINALKRVLDDIMVQENQSNSKIYYEYKRCALSEQFSGITSLHEEISLHEEDFNSTYFCEGEYEQIQTQFQEVMVILHEKQEELQEANSRRPSPDSISRLPRQNIPTFEGSYSSWPTFHDIFIRMIDSNTQLSAAEKMQYLKSSMKGEAAKLIRHLEISDANYSTAWQLIQERYQNRRVLLFTQLEVMASLLSMNTESARGLKNIHDTTRECMHAIKNLGIDTESWGPIIVFQIIKKLDKETRRCYEQSVKDPRGIPELNELLKFIETRFQSLENIKDQRRVEEYPKHNTNMKYAAKTFHTTQSECKFCKAPHSIYNCKKFRELNNKERNSFIKQKKLCVNCMNHDENVKCFSQQRCGICKRWHHSLLHSTTNSDEKATTVQRPVSSHTALSEKGRANNTKIKNQGKQVVLATALVKAKSNIGNYELLRALIDPGSQASFVTERAAQQLGLPKSRIITDISGVGNTDSGTSKSRVQLQLYPRFPSNFELTIEALVLPTLTKRLPSENISLMHLIQETNLMLADPTLESPGPIDVLIGADAFGAILLDGMSKPTEGLLAQKTEFGWILTGTVPQPQPSNKIISMVSMTELNQQLSKFWEIEEIQTRDTANEATDEENKCQEHFQQTYTRSSDGTYTVRIPFKDSVNNLGDSKKLATARLLQLERRLSKNLKLKEEYDKFMNEYIQRGHMIKVSNTTNPKGPVHYLPHQAVIKEESTTTKLRVVFDASAKSSTGTSLNDTMYVGPKLQENLPDILLRWRKHQYVFKADVEKMYRMIKIAKDQQDLQRILWRFSPNEPIREYALTTVTYGTSSAPYLAVRTMHQLAMDEKDRFPMASQIALKDFYIDDLMSGTDSIEDSRKLQLELIKLFKAGGFNLRKWTTNNKMLLNIIPEELREQGQVEINSDEPIKTLGIHWSPITDVFQFKVKMENKATVTKRMVLSDIARLFDPLGWLSPITVTAKIMMQELWKIENAWDQQLPVNLLEKWNKFRTELPHIESLKIPRWAKYTCKNTEIEIHGFCDASEKAYAAAVYMKTTRNGKVTITLLSAKTKVAPIKMKKTLPRLELCGAALLAKLLKQVKEAMELGHIKTYGWTDSMITLAWIRGGPGKWKTFVSNKVAEIASNTKGEITWNHVKSEDNPADPASRGIMPSKIKELKIWWEGPTWLKRSSTEWPITETEVPSTTEEQKPAETISTITTTKESQLSTLILRQSNLSKLVRVWAYCKRFINRCQKKITNITNYITPTETSNALSDIVRAVQSEEFAHEIKRLNAKKNLEKNSKLLPLNPFIDEEGTVRVGGRIRNANLSYNENYPIILPHQHHLTTLIISEAHASTLHGSTQITLAFIRRKFWIIRARSTIKQTLNKCMRCFRFKSRPIVQQMGELPKARVTPSKPFSHSGLDYAGPFHLRVSKGRGNKSYKGYLAVFVCLATKAVHLEAVTGLTTKEFLNAFRRFIARRGRCSHMYSDNATTFIGAQKVLDKELEQAIRNNKTLAQELADAGTEWHFIPPAAPHFGGIWEAGVKAVKYHIKRIIGELTLTFEEMSTMLSQIEACLNSRPLCPLTDDATDLNVLTPGHFLVGEALIGPAEPTYDESYRCLSRWQLIRKLSNDFWKIWTQDYLATLQHRRKWQSTVKNIKEGQLVLIKDETLPQLIWPLARVVETHPGSDGLVRVVTVRSKGNKLFKRPVTKICPLPDDDNMETNASTTAPAENISQREISKKLSCVIVTENNHEVNNFKHQTRNKQLQTYTKKTPLENKWQFMGERNSAVKRQIELVREAINKRNPKRRRIHPVVGYDILVPVEKQQRRTEEYRSRFGLNNLSQSKPNDKASPTKKQESTALKEHKPAVDFNDPTQPKRKRITLQEYRRRTQQMGSTTLTLLLVLFSLALGMCHPNITHPKPGVYVEEIGEVRIKRGMFRVELNYSVDEMDNDIKNINKTTNQMKTLCDSTLKITNEVHCKELTHYLDENVAELRKSIQLLRDGPRPSRAKRGVFGKLLQMVFGVNDEVYADINALDHNQKQLLHTVNHQTNIMLKTLANVNETDARTTRKLKSFTDKFNKAMAAFNEMQNWYSGPDTNKLNIHIFSAYHAATHFVEELQVKYNKLINVYLQRGNLLDLIQPSQLRSVLMDAKNKIPSHLDILETPPAQTKMEISEKEVIVQGFFYITEVGKYTLIKCSAIPRKEKEGEYVIMELPSSFLAINYNSQQYFTLEESELHECGQITQHEVMCTPTVVRNIETNPNCVIDELYQRQEAVRCPVHQVHTSQTIWKHLYTPNTWLFMASKPTTAALHCNGEREDVIIDGTGIIRIPQECYLQTKQNTLKSEITLKVPVRATFIKPVDINIRPPTQNPYTKIELESVLKPSDHIFNKLSAEGKQLQDQSFSWSIRTHAEATGLTISTLVILGAILYACLLAWRRWQSIQQTRKLHNNSSPDDHTNRTSEFELRPLPPRPSPQNV